VQTKTNNLPKVITECKSTEGRKESSCPNVPVHHLSRRVVRSDDKTCIRPTRPRPLRPRVYPGTGSVISLVVKGLNH